MNRIRRLSALAATAFLIAAGATFATAPPASADPICGTPDTPPCAGPNPLTPEQQCALIAWRTLLPCNWMGMQVPVGMPGSWG
jgi:hypothetical protein